MLAGTIMRSNISTHIGRNDENKKHIKHSIRIYVGANVTPTAKK